MLRIAVIVVGLVFLPRTLHAQCEYEVTAIIAAPPCAFTGIPATIGEAINRDRVVVGRYSDCDTSDRLAFRWSPERGFETLPFPPDGSDGQAHDINDRGELVVTFSMTGIGFRGHVLHDGVYEQLPSVDPAFGWSFAAAINNRGVVAGSRTIGGVTKVWPRMAFRWTAESGFEDAGLFNGNGTVAVCLNEAGVAAGRIGTTASFHPFIWRDQLVELPRPDGMISAEALDINVHDELLIRAILPNYDRRAFLWQNERYRPVRGLPGTTSILPSAMNDRRQVVGSLDPGGFLWMHDVAYRLDDLVESEAIIGIWRGAAIDNDGRILAFGITPDLDDVTFLLEPNARYADVTGDCRVNMHDVEFVLENWQTGRAVADIDGDGDVGFTDLTEVLAYFDWD